MKKTRTALSMLIIALIGSAGIGITLYFTAAQKNDSAEPAPPIEDKIDLTQQKFAYWAKVEDMSQISTIEADTIKSDIETNLTHQMQNLNLIKDTDYQITNLSNIKTGDHLNQYFNTIKIVATSEKAIGEFTINLTVQENITNRNITIAITAEEANGLSEDNASSIKTIIWSKVEHVLNQGQRNMENTDYQITNLDLIKTGAKFDEYNNQIKIKGISDRLTGEFLINFQIE